MKLTFKFNLKNYKKKPIPKAALARIAMLSKINLLASQTEDSIVSVQNSPKSGDLRDDLPELLSSIKRVQISVAGYTKLYPIEKQ